MSDLTDFLLARIAEDEAVAREAIPGTYSPNADEDGSWVMIEVAHEGIWPEPASKPAGEWVSQADEPWAIHVERHDPARVLAECRAKRGIIRRAAVDREDWGDGYDTAIEDVLCDLANVYADHPDYREEWKP